MTQHDEQPSDDYPVADSEEPSLDAKRAQLHLDGVENDLKRAGKVMAGIVAVTELLSAGIKKSGPGPGWGNLIK